ncbi:gag-pol polyprotein [Cucumis melo var. makuwa]|uniref:Gag-pol polyprotein n=1 Tax=Cucumis melo var. makuwa TaxID=1194695 RepID=A0A5D3DVK5_CUCMM|nr:gag-pol polyprotein [Cucumis melo var. makuwa]
MKKSPVATLSDEEDYFESDDEEVGMALISITTMNKEEAAKVTSQASDQQEPMEGRAQGIRPLCLYESVIIRIVRQKMHMTGNVAFFSELSECNAKSMVLVMEEKRLLANLINIIQLCDQGYQVSFSKDRCNVVVVKTKSFSAKQDCLTTVITRIQSLGRYNINGTSIAKVAKDDAIIGLPTLTFNPQECCSDCPTGKQVKSSDKSTSLPSTSRTLELLRIDLMRPMQTNSLGARKKGLLTPQQNDVVERKNRTLQEKARVMIHAKHLPIYFWVEALNTVCHIHNRYMLILSDREHHRKWDSKSDRGIFLGYSTNSRAYRVYNRHMRIVMESVNVIIDDHEKVSNGSVDEEDGDI